LPKPVVKWLIYSRTGDYEMVKIGDRLPDISVFSDDGSIVNLKSLEGQKTILYFYPKDNTPGCTNEAVAFEFERSKLESYGYRVVGVSADSAESHKNFKSKYLLGFSLLSDEKKELCEHYGVWVSKRMYGKSYMGIERSTFVYDEKGELVKIYRKVKPADHPLELVSDIEKGKLPN
jgi:peroxiredoxin Q/BCP